MNNEKILLKKQEIENNIKQKEIELSQLEFIEKKSEKKKEEEGLLRRFKNILLNGFDKEPYWRQKIILEGEISVLKIELEYMEMIAK